jgi:transporter family-2 protein
VNKNRESRIPRPLAYALAFVAGLAMSLQAHINGELGVALGSGIVAATLSFAGGVVVLAIAALASARIRLGIRSIRLALVAKQTSWMFTLAGAAGAAFVLSQSTVAPILGLATFTVAFVCGLTMGGLIMDRFGIGPAGHKPVTLARLAGAFLGVSAVVITSVGSTWTHPVTLGLIVPIICGVGVSWQQAANGRLTAVGQNAWATTLINFSVGFGLLLAATGIILSITRPVLVFPPNPWLYVGGPVGIVFIAIASIVVREIGILVYGLCATTGQLVSALAFDAIFPSGGVVSGALIAGVIVVAAGASLASLSGRSRKQR